MSTSKIRKDDIVMVMTGNDQGTRAKVLKVDPRNHKVVVEGVNIARKHVRPSQKNPQGGVLEIERPIHISNVLPINPKTDKPTRVRFVQENGKKQRVSMTGDVI
jgi:large subunit ribosomal protein L24